MEQTETWRPPGLGRQAPVRPLPLAVGTWLRAEKLLSRLPEPKGQVQPSVPPPPCSVPFLLFDSTAVLQVAAQTQTMR